MSETPRTPHTARATTGRRRRAPRQPYAWLGVGALTVGVGAALAAGSGVAYADTPHSAAASSTSSSTSPSSSAGPKASATRTFAVSKTTSSVGGSPLSHAATPTPNPVAAALRAATPASATPGVHPVLPFTAKPSPALAVFRSTASTPAAATTAAAAVVTTSVSPAATVAISPLHSVLTVVTNALLSLGGLNTTTPTPASGNLIQLALYSAARWLQDTFNPGGIPTAGTPIVGTPDPTTGALTFRPVFTDPAGAPLTYKVSVDPTLGTVSVNADGVYTFTPTTAERLLAPAGGTTVPLRITGYNGVQNTNQIINATVNPATLTLAPTTIPVGTDPAGLALGSNQYGLLGPVQSFLYVTNNGAGAGTTVSVISTATNTVTDTVTGLSDPTGVAIIPGGIVTQGNGAGGEGGGGATAYVANQSTNTVSVISTATNTVTATIPVGTNPAFVAAGPANTPAAGHLYVSNAGSNTVSVVDTATNKVTATIPVGSTPVGVAVSPDGTHVYVTDVGGSGNTVSVISTATNKVTATITVGSGPAGAVVSPDGTHLYVTNGISDTVSVINTATNKVTATIPVGHTPYFAAVSPDGSVVYVGNQTSGTVSVIDTATNAVIATIPVASDPVGVTDVAGLAVSPDGTKLYVANPYDKNVSVLNV